MNLVRSVLATSILFAATSSYGRDLNLGFSAGIHDGKIDNSNKQKFSSTSAKASLHTPLNEFVSVGLTLGTEVTDSNSQAYNSEGYGQIEDTSIHIRVSARDVSAEDICLEAKFSTPEPIVNGTLYPYFKVGRTLWSSYTYKGRISLESLDYDYTYKGTQSGYTYCLGTTFNLDDKLTFSAEIESTKKEILAKSTLSDAELEGDIKSVGLNLGLSVKV
ncbi:MAG: outer membrane beta-barrel protein [Oligoflexales bacterium]